MDVKGKSIKYLSSLTSTEVESLSTDELRRVTQRLASAANKRIKRLRESGLASRSAAYRGLRSGIMHKGKIRKFSTTAKTIGVKPMKYKRTVYGERNGKRVILHRKGDFVTDKAGRVRSNEKSRLRNEYERAVRFLNDKTSNIAGTKEAMRKVEQRIGKFKSKAQENRFWATYTSLSNEYRDLTSGRKISTDEIQAMVYERMFEKTPSGKRRELDPEQVINDMQGELERMYAKKEGEQIEESPFSVRFEKVKIF